MTESTPRGLSELEGVCLGIVSRLGPCTAYRVRLELKESPSSHWRASAGSVYPLLARLEEEGLIAASADDKDGRGRKLLCITNEARASLKNWILAGATAELISSVTDPVRSRMFFLDALSSSQRTNYLDTLIRRMEAYLAETHVRLQEDADSGSLFDQLGSLGAVKITEARLDWLRAVREKLGDS